MNQEKAREFYSTYYEGNLEPGLKQALEQAMGRDASIRSEYREFEQTYEELGSLKFETIEIPFDLNDKILANIDRHLYENRRAQQPAWIIWLRNAAIAGVSCVAILGAALSLRNFGSRGQEAGQAGLGFVPTGASTTKDQLTVEPGANRDATIHFQPSDTETLVIREGLNGPERSRVTVLQGEDYPTRLQNPNAEATVFDLEAKGDKSELRPTLIALPGSSSSSDTKGQGDLEDLAKALASYYRVPVEIKVATPTVTVNWNFQAPDAVSAARNALDPARYAITWGENNHNLLVISED